MLSDDLEHRNNRQQLYCGWNYDRNEFDNRNELGHGNHFDDRDQLNELFFNYKLDDSTLAVTQAPQRTPVKMCWGVLALYPVGIFVGNTT